MQLTRRNSYRDLATIHKSKSNKYLRISTANMLDGTQRISTNRFPSESYADIMYFGCIYLLYIDGVNEYRTTQTALYFEYMFKYQWSIPK